MEIIKEACVGNLEQAINAQNNGAHRIELCARLDLGGTTPSKQLIQDCINQLDIPIKVMIRPRGGNFIYSQSEIDSMIKDIQLCQSLGVTEIVTGMLNEMNQIDIIGMQSLSANVGKMPITFHKAIDEVKDYKFALEQLKNIPQVKYLLTSGQKKTAIEGVAKLKEMISICGDDITVIVAGKVTNYNIDKLHDILNATEYHGKLIVGPIS